MKHLFFTLIVAVAPVLSPLHAQEDGGVTNAFDDLKRTGRVTETDSEMRRKASPEAVARLLQEHPRCGFFCFTEDRANDIRLRDALPAHWMERPADERATFRGTCAPGEFYTWQIGVYAPYTALDGVDVRFSTFKSDDGARIPASALRCFNLGGTGSDGKPFRKHLSVPKGEVQPLWIGMDMTGAAPGTYRGKVTVKAGRKAQDVYAEITVKGDALPDGGVGQGWRKSRLRWLDSGIGRAEEPTAPYIPVKYEEGKLSYLGGSLELAPSGLPRNIVTRYDAANRLDPTVANALLDGEMRFVVETDDGEETLTDGRVKLTGRTSANVTWTAVRRNRNFEITCNGSFAFDGFACYNVQVKARRDVQVRDICMEVPYTANAARYMMGLGHKGGYRPDTLIRWHWDVVRHQDKVWLGNVNGGLNFCFMDENYVRPLVNIYYALGRLNLPVSWGNGNLGGIDIAPERNGEVRLTAYSGRRTMRRGEVLHYNFNMLITPVKPIDLAAQATERFYHANGDVSTHYIEEAKKYGANLINIHHKKDIYPFINYPYYDEAVPDLKRFVDRSHAEGLKTRVYYTTRELTAKVPELWALRSLGGEVIHDGPGRDARTLIHPNGPNVWLNENLGDHFIPAWYNAFKQGKYAGDMDVSVITTPDSRWNNYYLEGLDWMIKNLGIDGIYIDDSALDRRTLQRARRILDADGQRRLVDMHSWNHMNQWAGYANSIHLYTELLPYVDRLWLGEGFSDAAPADFWLVELSGIPFGLMSESLQTRNRFRGMVFGMLPRLAWSGNPVPLWKVWDEFGMKTAVMHGFWEPDCLVATGNDAVKATVFTNGDTALLVMANWSDSPQRVDLSVDADRLGFRPSSFTQPEIKGLQSANAVTQPDGCELLGGGGAIWLLAK